MDEAAEHRRLGMLIEEGRARRLDRARFIALAAAIDGDEAAIEAGRAAVDAFPAAADLRYQLGARLLGFGDDAGIDEIERAIALWSDFGTPGYRAIVDHLVATERAAEADFYAARIAQSAARDRLASAELNTIDEKTSLLPLEWDPEDRQDIIGRLSRIEGLNGVIAGRRWVTHSGQDQFVFVFRALGVPAQHVLDQIIDVLIDYGNVLGLESTSKNKWLAHRLAGLDGSRLL
jgi:hypothetical protein